MGLAGCLQRIRRTINDLQGTTQAPLQLEDTLELGTRSNRTTSSRTTRTCSTREWALLLEATWAATAEELECTAEEAATME